MEYSLLFPDYKDAGRRWKVCVQNLKIEQRAIRRVEYTIVEPADC